MDSFRVGPWEITTSQGHMMGRDLLSHLESETNIKLPCLIYNNTFASLKHLPSGFKYEILSKDSVKLIGLEQRARSQQETDHNFVSFIPKDAKVSSAAHWQNRTVPKGSTFSEDSSEQVAAQVFSAGNDWTFTTLYKGSPSGSFTVGRTEQDIPVNRLGMDNPILWASEILIYEDELDDNGHVKFTFRVRAMNDCLFALLRCYLRIDHVMVRVCDTRIFNDYTENTILREFQVKEATYEELRNKGFDTGPQWTLNSRQSDLVFGSLNLEHSYKDRISFN